MKMSRTFRTKSPKIKVETLKNKKVKDGTRTRVSHSCENNGSCPYCQSNRQHSTKKRIPLTEDEVNSDIPSGE